MDEILPQLSPPAQRGELWIQASYDLKIHLKLMEEALEECESVAGDSPE
jgi:chaperonin cofactor prefoldin